MIKILLLKNKTQKISAQNIMSKNFSVKIGIRNWVAKLIFMATTWQL